ncbi:hypothetical protein C8R44DRAFT_726053 [Mycena epipterygia]|nr:hypothetical protein C8R44DRAFT_726053 [Mycena epipterygia]
MHAGKIVVGPARRSAPLIQIQIARGAKPAAARTRRNSITAFNSPVATPWEAVRVWRGLARSAVTVCRALSARLPTLWLREVAISKRMSQQSSQSVLNTAKYYYIATARIGSHQLHRASAISRLNAVHARNTELTRKRAALDKRVSRIPDRIESGVVKLSCKSMKDHGIISTDIRAYCRNRCTFGRVSKIIHAVAKAPAASLSRGGGVAAQLQIVNAVKNVEHFTGSGDGTSHKHMNYESHFLAINEKLLALGLTQAPNHTSEEQMAGWQRLVDEMYETYNASPLGRLYPEDPRSFFLEIMGMMTDHANDQMKLRTLFKLTAPKLLDVIYALTDEKIEDADGMEAWDALPALERVRINGTLHGELCKRYGQQEFDELPEEEQNEADFFLGGGCFMHKDLNAHRVSSQGGVKLCELMGMLLNNKDDKKGMQDGHGVYFDAHEHIRFAIRFPDTSNTLYQCFSEASAEIITNLPAINYLRTIIELVVLVLYGQNFSHPIMRTVRSSVGGLRNLWDQGPATRKIMEHCRRVIADPDIICGANLSYETASMDGQPWERPEAMYAAHALLPTLPMNEVRAALVAFLEGALETWERFDSDVLSVDLTDAQKQKAWMPATNDANEGWLGTNSRVAKRRAPNATLEFINAKSQYKHNDTGDFIAEKLDTPEGQQFLRRTAQAIGSEGREKKRKIAQSDHDKKTVTEHRDKKQKSDSKKSTELKAINECTPILDISQFQDPSSLKDILKTQIILQLKWHRLQELETDKKTEVPPLSKLNKPQMVELVIATLERWLPRVESGEVLRLGRQVPVTFDPEEEIIELEAEDDDAGSGEQD